MMSYQPVRKLNVSRRLATNKIISVGTLVKNSQAIYFQYNPEYLQSYSSLSPFKLNFDHSLQIASKHPHFGLHGLFDDSLPDGWGRLLMDRIYRQKGLMPQQISPLDRLSYIGQHAMGALQYSPAIEDNFTHMEHSIDLYQLGTEAQNIFEGQASEVLTQLAYAGSSAGARPKALIYTAGNLIDRVSTQEAPELTPWLIKFTSSSLSLGHEESLCESTYLNMAQQAGINVPEWQLIPTHNSQQGKAWLALKRFDCTAEHGRLHMHTASGLLDADFRMPSLDYEDLIKASQMLCQSPSIGQEVFARMIFNLFSLNQDDHSKNWSFLQNDNGQWHLSPFYDITFSPNPHGEHTTALLGYGKKPPLKIIQKLAEQANFSNWKQAQLKIQEIVDSIQNWDHLAREQQIDQTTRTHIQKQINTVRKDNQSLFTPANIKLKI